MKKLLACVVILIAGNLAFAQQALFDARPTFGTGPQTSPAEALPFASTSLILGFKAEDTAVISSTPDGTGSVVIDNFMTINDVNACEGVIGPGGDSCFGPFIQNPGDPGVVGMPIETVLTPIPPIDVKKFIPVGTKTPVLFQLRDFGSIAGNTDLFLVTTGTIVASNVNNLVTFDPVPSTATTTTDTSGCPTGFVGKFSFDAKLINAANTPESNTLHELWIEVETLTEGNRLLSVDPTNTRPPAGARFFPLSGDLDPKDFVNVRFRICLKEKKPFIFRVNVLGATAALTPEAIKKLLSNNGDVNSPAKFLETLPLEYKQHWILMTNRESAQKSTATEPRLLLPNADASKVFGFCTVTPCRIDEDFIEYIQFHKSSNKFRFTEIRFPERKSPEVEIEATRCQACHTSPNPRPNWDAYDNWANMLPFNRDRLYENSEEEKAFTRPLKDLRADPLVKQLELPKGVTRNPEGEIIIDPTQRTNDPSGSKTVSYSITLPDRVVTYPGPNPVSVIQGGKYLLLHHSRNDPDEGRGVELFDNFTVWNAKRVAQELLDHPKGANIHPVALAIASKCVNASNLRDFASPTALDKFYKFLTVTTIDKPETPTDERFNDLLEKTRTARQSLPQKKANEEAVNVRGLMIANGTVLPTAQEITRQVAQRSQQIFDLDKLTGFMIDRESYGDDTNIALFRLFLEPWDVRVRQWSMNVFTRPNTYTFADLFSKYEEEINRTLKPAVSETSCTKLAEMSRAALGDGPPLSPLGSGLALNTTGIPLVVPPGPDLVVETLGCNGVSGLEFRTSNVGTESADGFRNNILFFSRATGQEVDRPTIPQSDEPALILGTGESTVLSVPVPMACLVEDVPGEQKGCDVLAFADSEGAVEEPDDANNMARSRCGP